MDRVAASPWVKDSPPQASSSNEVRDCPKSLVDGDEVANQGCAQSSEIGTREQTSRPVTSSHRGLDGSHLELPTEDGSDDTTRESTMESYSALVSGENQTQVVSDGDVFATSGFNTASIDRRPVEFPASDKDREVPTVMVTESASMQEDALRPQEHFCGGFSLASLLASVPSGDEIVSSSGVVSVAPEGGARLGREPGLDGSHASIHLRHSGCDAAGASRGQNGMQVQARGAEPADHSLGKQASPEQSTSASSGGSFGSGSSSNEKSVLDVSSGNALRLDVRNAALRLFQTLDRGGKNAVTFEDLVAGMNSGAIRMQEGGNPRWRAVRSLGQPRPTPWLSPHFPPGARQMEGLMAPMRPPSARRSETDMTQLATEVDKRLAESAKRRPQRRVRSRELSVGSIHLSRLGRALLSEE